jgi:rubrerythrin
MDDPLKTIEEAIGREARMEALLLRGARSFTSTVHRSQVRRMARENRDHSRILRRHLRELRGGPKGPGRTPRRVLPLGPMRPPEALEEALSYKTILASYYEEIQGGLEDRYLRKFVEILARCEREDRRLLLAMIDAEERNEVPIGADEYEADQEMDRLDSTEAA